MGYPKTNIFIKNKHEFNLSVLYNELALMGDSWHQNNDNSERKELFYFMGNASVVVSEYKVMANIKIISEYDLFLSGLKSKIEKILEKSVIPEID